MIELNDDDDTMLFAVTIPTGRLVIQYMETLTALQEDIGLKEQPTVAQIAAAIRRSSRTPDVAKDATDAHLIAAWQRMTTRVQAAGNG